MTATVEETLNAKQDFELFASSHGVQILNYHADNGVFRANNWTKACQSDPNPQGMMFAGVDDHHTNGLVERRIWYIQDNSRAMMIHATHKWKTHTTINLWPYSLRLVNQDYNNTPLLGRAEGKTPTQLFTSTEVDKNPNHWHTFGCPAYVLTPQLRSGARIHHKWKQQSELGIYLGTSPVHHINVALILNSQTGLVSPQFNVCFDPEFTTVPDHTERSLWQSLSGFVRGTQTCRLDLQKRRNQTEELSLQQLPPSDLAPNPHHQEG